MASRLPLAPHGPEVPETHPKIDWHRVASNLLALHADHPGAWLIVCPVTPSRRPFSPSALRANPSLNEIEVERFLRRTLPQKNESAEKRVRTGWEVWMRVAP